MPGELNLIGILRSNRVHDEPFKQLFGHALVPLLFEQLLLAQVVAVGAIQVARGAHWLNGGVKTSLYACGSLSASGVEIGLHGRGPDVESSRGVASGLRVLHDCFFPRSLLRGGRGRRSITGFLSRPISPITDSYPLNKTPQATTTEITVCGIIFGNQYPE